jgi:hypothetical protein
LDAAPEDERTLFLIAGQFVNELNILTKLDYYFAKNSTSQQEIVKRANMTASMLLFQLTAGKANEGWELVKERFSPLYPRYEANLDDATKERLEELKKYFGKRNLVNAIRNRAGFHFDGEVMAMGYAEFPNTEVFRDYLAESHGNSLYYSAAIISTVGIAKITSESDWKAGLDKFAQEVPCIARKVADFLIGYMTAFIDKYVAINDISEAKFEIEDGPPLDKVTIPLFCLPPVDHSA